MESPKNETAFYELKLRIDWSEMDLFGHVNNVMFMKYIQAARVNCWEQTGLHAEMQELRIFPMLASVSCRYKKPLYYPGQVIIRTSVAYIKNTSFSFEHVLLNETGDIVAEATDIMVTFDPVTEGKVPFPEKTRKKLGG